MTRNCTAAGVVFQFIKKMFYGLTFLGVSVVNLLRMTCQTLFEPVKYTTRLTTGGIYLSASRERIWTLTVHGIFPTNHQTVTGAVLFLSV